MRHKASLAALTKHPSWPDYIEAHRIALAAVEKKMLLMLKGTTPFDRAQMERWRGQVDVLEWQIAAPKQAEASLIRYLRSQGVEIAEDEEELSNV